MRLIVATVVLGLLVVGGYFLKPIISATPAPTAQPSPEWRGSASASGSAAPRAEPTPVHLDQLGRTADQQNADYLRAVAEVYGKPTATPVASSEERDAPVDEAVVKEARFQIKLEAVREKARSALAANGIQTDENFMQTDEWPDTMSAREREQPYINPMKRLRHDSKEVKAETALLRAEAARTGVDGTQAAPKAKPKTAGKAAKPRPPTAAQRADSARRNQISHLRDGDFIDSAPTAPTPQPEKPAWEIERDRLLSEAWHGGGYGPPVGGNK